MVDYEANSVALEADGREEITADLLKNTPSNIARLEDVIENCVGRQKYLAQTRSPSDGSDVRWYFWKVPLAENELAASVPRTEVVGKNEYFRFGIRDSLAIEASFLQREEELLSIWWKEYAECSEGPRVRATSKKKLDMGSKIGSSLDVAGLTPIDEDDEERVGVPVKGGLYEVDLLTRHCFPVYWNGENRRVLRGHWFARKGGLDWLPLREDVSEQLEIAYRSKVWRRRRFQPSGLFAARVDLQGSSLGLHALFTGEDDTWEAWLSVDASGFSGVIGFVANGIKLRRGYSPSHSSKPSQEELRQQKEEEMDDYCSQVPVQHLVFMVHGIGQRLEKSNLVDDVTNFRHITADLAERNLTSHQRATQRVLFIPCQWRKGLKLSGEAAVDNITLDGVRGLRVMLSATAHDVLYYMSSIYCQTIIDSVSNQLNRLYLKFIKRNPGYSGKVSLYGHSLGSVLSYDILCHQENLSSPFPMDLVYKQHVQDEEFSGDEKSTQHVNKQSSDGESLSNVEQEEYALSNGAGELLDQADQDMMIAQLPLSEKEPKDADELSSLVGSCESAMVQTNLSMDLDPTSSKGEVHQPLHDYSDIPSQDEDQHVAGNVEHAAEGNQLENIVEEECRDASESDRTIRLLKEEIDALKLKLAEIESQSTSGGADARYLPECKEISPVPKQSFTVNLPPDGDDTPETIKYTKLEFKVDTFFAVGAPLGVFLALRNVRLGVGKGQDYWANEDIIEEMPACRQMFNIFHPYDPVAYRIEPLVCEEYISKRPVIIPYHKGGKRLHIGFQDFTEELGARSQAIMDRLTSLRTRVLTVCQSRSTDDLEEESDNADEKQEISYGSVMMERLTGSKEGRIDHVLQDKTFEHPYLQAIGAHTNYWRDYDTALFILKHLYRDIPEDPTSLWESKESKTTGISRSHSWTNRRESEYEEFSLTFSDTQIVKNFSRKGKTFTK